MIASSRNESCGMADLDLVAAFNLVNRDPPQPARRPMLEDKYAIKGYARHQIYGMDEDMFSGEREGTVVRLLHFPLATASSASPS